MFVSRSSFEKPRPLLRCVRTTSPSSTSTLRLIARSSRSTISDTVDFPAPERPVNQIVKPVVVIVIPFSILATNLQLLISLRQQGTLYFHVVQFVPYGHKLNDERRLRYRYDYASRSALINTWATSGRVNCGGGGVPQRSSSRTLVPLSDSRCSGPCGQVRGDAIVSQAWQ